MNPAANILRLRLERGLTQAQLARASGLAQPNIAAYESRRRNPTLHSLSRLASALGVDVSSVLGEAKRPDPLDRFEFDALSRAMIQGKNPPAALPKAAYLDLLALFHPKLMALHPARRRRPRLSANAAQRRLKAMFGGGFLEQLNRRLEKRWPG